ncbi:hypothetical protein DVH24_030471 [Malus domestica]|uniref:HhH-GPD domain-containing protein n=1 Tax=Malus domestica TaxID=3750 RepID=A0A498JX52_MALDO|nr:hypothetical protein DVH24_030471 [Malus domestica]
MGPAADANNIFSSYVDDCSATPCRVTDVSTAQDKSTSKKRGYDAIYLRHKQPKSVRIQMEDKSKGEILIGGKRTKSPKPVKLKETRSSKCATAQKLPNVGRYNRVSVRKVQNDTQAQSMKQDQKAHGDILGKRNKSVHQVGPSDSTLRWHAQPQIDWSKDVSDNIKDKEEWWEEETKLFCKRANSFIACMNQVQGNRHFSAWRGSVVDSVVGAFLTQNAKDQSSSSAFMSLAAKYPTIQMEQACDYARNEKNVRSIVGWDFLEYIYYTRRTTKERSNDTMDSLDWEAVREAPLTEISKSILGRGMNNKLAERIKGFLDILKRDHGSIDLEWLRDASPEGVKKYLLSIDGIGLKCVECVRLLALKQHAFPVDTNVARIVMRLGWIPIQPLHWKLQHHHLKSARSEGDIEDLCIKVHDKNPTIKVNPKGCKIVKADHAQSKQKCFNRTSESLQEVVMSKSSAPVPTSRAPRSKRMSQFRTKHQVYELPDAHHILKGLERREPDDPCPYLLVVWSSGKLSNPVGSTEGQTACFDENGQFLGSNGEDTAQTVLGTILIPCRTAMRGTFPLNGTYFQANEVLADYKTSENPIDVPVSSIQHLRRRTLYCGNSVSGIFIGLLTKEIRDCFKKGFICVRGFDRKTREPKPLARRLHRS